MGYWQYIASSIHCDITNEPFHYMPLEYNYIYWLIHNRRFVPLYFCLYIKIFNNIEVIGGYPCSSLSIVHLLIHLWKRRLITYSRCTIWPVERVAAQMIAQLSQCLHYKPCKYNNLFSQMFIIILYHQCKTFTAFQLVRDSRAKIRTLPSHYGS